MDIAEPDGMSRGLAGVAEPKVQPNELVTLPRHYGRHKMEPIRFIVENNGPGFLVENATKYLWRYDAKNGHEDLGKTARYLEMLRAYEAGRSDWWGVMPSGLILPNSPLDPLRSLGDKLPGSV